MNSPQMQDSPAYPTPQRIPGMAGPGESCHDSSPYSSVHEAADRLHESMRETDSLRELRSPLQPEPVPDEYIRRLKTGVWAAR